MPNHPDKTSRAVAPAPPGQLPCSLLRHVALALLLATGECGIASENGPLDGVLVVCAASDLRDDIGHTRTRLPEGSLVRRVRSIAPPVVNNYIVLAETLDAVSPDCGWLDARALSAPLSPKREPTPVIPQYDTGEFPEQVLRSSPHIAAMWFRVQQQISDNHASGELDPEPYIRRGRLWSAVYNRDRATQDYTIAARLAIQTAKNDLEAVDALKNLKTLFARIRPIPAIPQPVPLNRHPSSDSYAAGYHAYWAGDFLQALSAFDTAIESNPHEPIYWYYRAFTHRRLQNIAEAEEDASAGAFWEHQVNLATRDRTTIIHLSYIGNQLERVQGSERLWLEAFRRYARPRPRSFKDPPLHLDKTIGASRFGRRVWPTEF